MYYTLYRYMCRYICMYDILHYGCIAWAVAFVVCVPLQSHGKSKREKSACKMAAGIRALRPSIQICMKLQVDDYPTLHTSTSKARRSIG